MQKNLSCNRMPDEQKYKVTSGDFIGAIGYGKPTNIEQGKITLTKVMMPPSPNTPRGFKIEEYTFPQGTEVVEYNEGGRRRRKQTHRKKSKRVRTRRA